MARPLGQMTHSSPGLASTSGRRPGGGVAAPSHARLRRAVRRCPPSPRSLAPAAATPARPGAAWKRTPPLAPVWTEPRLPDVSSPAVIIPPRSAAMHTTLALVRRARRASGAAWEAGARQLVVHHPGAPRPPAAWAEAERRAAVVGPRAAFAELVSGEEVAVEPVPVLGTGDGGEGVRRADSGSGAPAGQAAGGDGPGGWDGRQPAPLACPAGASATTTTTTWSWTSTSTSTTSTSTVVHHPPPVCHLAPRPRGHRIADPAVAAYLNALFTSLPALRREAGLPAIELSRFDLFHGHVFWAQSPANAAKSRPATPGFFGVLFHCREYPARCEAFPHDLGFCQRGSPLPFCPDAADWRNVVMAGGHVASLRCDPSGLLGRAVLWPELAGVRTLVEDDAGVWAGVDLTYLVGSGGTGGGQAEEGGRVDRVLAHWVGGGGREWGGREGGGVLKKGWH